MRVQGWQCPESRCSERLLRGMRPKPRRCLGSFSERKSSEASSYLLKSMEEGEENRVSKEVQDARVVGRPGVSKGHREGLSLGV